MLKYITNGVTPTVRLIVSCLERPEEAQKKTQGHPENLLDSASSFQSHKIEQGGKKESNSLEPGLLDILEHKSVCKIQSYVKMKLAQKKSRKLRIVLRKIKFIQSWIRVWIKKKKTK